MRLHQTNTESRKLLLSKKNALRSIATAHVTGVGNALIYDRVCNSIGLTAVLKKAFPNDWTQILICACYLIGEGKALSHCGVKAKKA